MNTAEAAITKTATIKIVGVGNAGISVLDQVISKSLPGASFAAINSDAASVGASAATEKISLEIKSARGRGGGDLLASRASAEEHLLKLKDLCAGTDVVFIVTGLGGAAGSGISPVLARAAREAGALVLAFVTLPFPCEGNHRQQQAALGLDELKAAADGIICLPNERMLKLIDENTRVMDTFKATTELLVGGVSSVWRLIAHKGLIEIHFADLCSLLRDRHGESAFATAEAAGPTRSREVTDKLFAHPMLDGGRVLPESDAVLVSLVGGPDLTMAEINRVMEQITAQCGRAQVIMGAAIDETFAERLSVTLVAARRGEEAEPAPSAAEGARAPEELNEQLLNRAPSARPRSRCVPPPPVLSPEKLEQLAKQQTGRGRKSGPKMRQGQLSLEIFSKGRFDKSEPTIHKGEDLDVPTYIRRGMALN